MIRRRFIGTLGLAAGFCGGGCTPESCRIPNSDLSMVARAVDSGSTVRVEVDFATGQRSAFPIPWAACEGDRVAINGEDAQEAVKNDRVEYSIRFDPALGPQTVSVELDRASADEVVFAQVQRPPPFEILEPAPQSSWSRSDAQTIRWDPPLDDSQIRIELTEEIGGGLCIVTADPEHDYKGFGGVRVPDTGTWTIPAGVLTNSGDPTCSARYSLSRFREGEYPDALADGGFVEAQVLRIVAFESTP